MRYFLLIIGMLTSFCVAAESCISNFSAEKSLNEIIQGNEIHTPFTLSSLIEGMNEPEIKYEELNNSSLKKIIKIVSGEYKFAKTRGATKLVKENKIIFRGPNSGYYIEYKFKPINGCWKLVGFTNAST